MVESNKKTLWMGLAAAGTLLGAALVYYWITSEDDDEATPQGEGGDRLEEDLKAAKLHVVKKNAHGMLDEQYFLQLLQFVGEVSRERIKSKRE